MYVASRVTEGRGGDRRCKFFSVPRMLRTGLNWSDGDETRNNRLKEMFQEYKPILRPYYKTAVEREVIKNLTNEKTSQDVDEKRIREFIDQQQKHMMRDQYLRHLRSESGYRDVIKSIENVRKAIEDTEAGQNIYILENELLASNVLERLFVFQNVFPSSWTDFLLSHSIIYMIIFVVVSFLSLFFLFWLLLAVLALNACNGSGQPPHSLFLRANPQTNIPMTCGDITSGCTFAMQGLFPKMDMIQYFSLRVGFYFFSFVPVIFLFVMSSNKMRRIERTLMPTVHKKRGFDTSNNEDEKATKLWPISDRMLEGFSVFLFFISHIAGAVVTLAADMGMARYLTNTLPGEPGCSYSKDSTVANPSGFTTANCACNELLVQDPTNLPSLTLFQITNLPSLVEATLAFNILYSLWGLIYFLDIVTSIRDMWNSQGRILDAQDELLDKEHSLRFNNFISARAPISNDPPPAPAAAPPPAAAPSAFNFGQFKFPEIGRAHV